MESFSRRVARMIFGKVLPRTSYPVVTGPLKGARFILGSLSGEGGGASVYFNQMETEQTAAMIGEIRPGGTFFDIGANVGFYSILASRLVGTDGNVVAFEPLVRNLSYLQRHVELNHADNVRVLPFALSSENTILSFATGPNSAMGHLSRDGGEMLVPTVTLDDIAERLGLMPDVMKMDVEGAEMDVFRGASRVLSEAKPTIFLSTHSPELRDECLALLSGHGYSVESLIATDDPHEFLAKRTA
jgi:FkbM family methyltransferase